MNLKDVRLSDIVRVRINKRGDSIVATVVSVEPDGKRVLVIDEDHRGHLLGHASVVEMIYHVDKFIKS